MSKIKCCFCNKEILSNEDRTKYKGKNAHCNCLSAVIKQTADDKKKQQAVKATVRTGGSVIVKETTAKKTKEEIQAQKEFQEYVRKLTQHDPKVEHYALAQKYIKEYKITYHEIVLGLKFWFDVLHNSFDEDKNFVGIIPYVIEQALVYYEKEKEAIIENQTIDVTRFYKAIPVYIKPKPRHLKQIDIATII